jgi:hypothetical protein
VLLLIAILAKRDPCVRIFALSSLTRRVIPFVVKIKQAPFYDGAFLLIACLVFLLLTKFLFLR